MFGGGRRQNHETGTISGDTGDTGHWSPGGIILAPALQGNNHQAHVSPCLLSPPSCNLQTADSLQTCRFGVCFGKSRKELLNDLQRTTYFHFWPYLHYMAGHVRARVTCLPRVSWQRVTCHELSGGWTLVCICPLSSLHIIIICQKYWTQTTRNIK